MNRAIKCRIYPNKEQRVLFEKTFGCCRFLYNRMLTDRLTGEPVFVQQKISQIRNAAGRDTGVLSAGEVGTVYGLGNLEIGHVFGNPDLLPRKVQPGTLKTPLIMIRIIPEKQNEIHKLREACAVLSSEDPLLHAGYNSATGEMILQIMGKVQLEIYFQGIPQGYSAAISAPGGTGAATGAEPGQAGMAGDGSEDYVDRRELSSCAYTSARFHCCNPDGHSGRTSPGRQRTA